MNLGSFGLCKLFLQFLHAFDFIRIGELRIPFAFQLDALSSLFLLIITGIGFLIHLYSLGYMGHDADMVRFFVYLNLLLLLAVVSASETAIHSARDVEAQLLAAGEGSVAEKLRAITANPFAQLHRALLLSAALNLALAALGPVLCGRLRVARVQLAPFAISIHVAALGFVGAEAAIDNDRTIIRYHNPKIVGHAEIAGRGVAVQKLRSRNGLFAGAKNEDPIHRTIVMFIIMRVVRPSPRGDRSFDVSMLGDLAPR